jgi:hypothetical protein
MAVLILDPAGPVRNISNCSLAPLAFNLLTISVVSFDDWTRLCLNQTHPLLDQEGRYMQSFHMLCILTTATSSQRLARSCSGITAAENAALVSFQQSYNLEGEFPKH